MKKVMILLVSLFMLCGCTVVYDLDVENGYTETIKVTADNDEEALLIQQHPQNDAALYNQTVDPEDEGREDNLNYYTYKMESNSIIASFKFKDNYAKSNAANQCFPSLVYLKNENITRINTTSDFECFNYYPNLKSVLINIKVPYEVVSHNADSVSGNTYSWVYLYDGSIKSIDIQFRNPESSKKDKNLDTYKAYFDTKSKKIEDDYNKKHPKKDYSKYLPLFIGLCGLFFIGIFAIIIFGNRSAK